MDFDAGDSRAYPCCRLLALVVLWAVDAEGGEEVYGCGRACEPEIDSGEFLLPGFEPWGGEVGYWDVEVGVAVGED